MTVEVSSLSSDGVSQASFCTSNMSAYLDFDIHVPDEKAISCHNDLNTVADCRDDGNTLTLATAADIAPMDVHSMYDNEEEPMSPTLTREPTKIRRLSHFVDH